MSEQEHSKLADLLHRSLPAVSEELPRDLWPQMRRRLDERAAGRNWLALLLSPKALSSAPWFDWALLAVLVASACIFPRSILIWLYHL